MFGLAPEHADAMRGVHLVAGEGEEVAAELTHVDGHVSDALRPVEQGHRADGFRLGAEFARDLGRLKDALPPFPRAQALIEIEPSLGRPADSLFHDLGEPVVEVVAVRPVLAGAPVDADAVVLANGIGAMALVPDLALPIRAGRGLVSHLAATATPPLDIVVTRLGYVTPPVDGLRADFPPADRSLFESALAHYRAGWSSLRTAALPSPLGKPRPI